MLTRTVFWMIEKMLLMERSKSRRKLNHFGRQVTFFFLFLFIVSN